MLARSLVIFIAVGVVSGLMFGIYLYDISSQNELVFVEGPSVSILTDKTVYKQGDTVHIRIVNTGTVPLVFSDSSFGFKITGLAGFVIYGASSGGNDGAVDTNTENGLDGVTEAGNTLQTLEPGKQVTLSWDMLKTDRTPVLAGVYKLHTSTADSAPITASVTVTVV